MTISKRLLVLMIIAISALIIVGGQFMVQMNRVYQAANYGNENVVPSILQLNLAQRQFMQMRIRIYRLTLSVAPKTVAEIESQLEESKIGFNKAMDAYEKLVSNDEDRQLLQTERRLFNDYSSKLPPILAAAHQQQQQQALELMTSMLPLARDLQETLEKHMHLNEKLGQESALAAGQTMQSAMTVSIIVAIAAILTLAFLTLQIRAGLNRRLGEANRLAAAVASGNLRYQTNERGNDEAGQLIEAMDNMRRDLGSTVGNIVSGSQRLANSANELSASARQVSSRSGTQSEATASSAAALEELTVSIDHVGDRADEASHQAHAAGEQAETSARNVQEAVKQIERVASNVEATAKQIHSLSEQVQKIGNITTVIREVADQTNLLALNAAIEAARAGEQGRGFAVVADEVRKLAERTTLSVQEISTLISAIQGSVATTVDGMQSNRNQVTEVVSTAREASASMDTIRHATETVRDAIQGISDAMREQRSAAGELSRNVESIAQMSEENANAVNSVASTASSLVAVSDDLKTAVSRFNV